MKKYLFFAVCFMLFSLPLVLHGQGFTGHGHQQSFGHITPVAFRNPVSITEAVRLPHDSWVVLTGHIISALPGRNYYTFRDSSGEIAVEIGTKHWRGLSVGVNDRVVIYGEVKVNRVQTFIKVHAITGEGRVSARQGQPVTIIHPITISEAVALPHDSFVVIEGNIANFQSRNNYTFRDFSGEITADIGQKHWRGLSVGASDRVVIYGEVKIARGVITIKVHAIFSAN